MRIPRRVSALVAAFTLVFAGGVAAQVGSSLGIGTTFQGYSFDDELGTDKANLLMVPVAIRLASGERFQLDLFGAWAEGRVERDDQVFVLNGFVDSRVRLSLRASPWAVVSVSANLPTGESTHDSEEAVVASVLSSDLLGFQESNWGVGGAITTGVATAHNIGGGWAVGLGASYRVSDDFEPRADTALAYQPGNESRFRVALDKNVGESGKFTIGGTFQMFDTDELDGRNLFEAGNRIRGDVAFAFRAGSSTFNLFAADVYREEGDLSLQIINDAGAVVGDSAVATNSQNLLVAGIQASLPVGSTVYFRPIADIRIQTVDNAPGDPESGGWIAGFGGDLPLRLFGAFDFFPRAKGSWGKLKLPEGGSRTVWGFEASGTVRFR